MTDLDGAALDDVVGRALGRAVAVEIVGQLSGGASRQTYALTARPVGPHGRPEGGDDVELVLQRQRGAESPMACSIAAQAALVAAADDAGVPVAPLVATGDGEGDGLGAPWLLSRRVEGETIARRIQRDDRFAAARPGFAAACGQALGGIHGLDPAIAPGLADDDKLGRLRAVVDELGLAQPVFELAFRRLEANRPPARASTVVHGDFRLGNLLLDEGGLRAVLDWELAHLGDPLEDIAWCCVRAWRFGAPHPVGGIGAREELWAAYEEVTGQAVDPPAAAWWEVLGTLSWGVICVVQVTTHLTGLARSHELAAIGRRVCEAEHDLLELLP